MKTQRRNRRVGWAVLAVFLIASLLLPGPALADESAPAPAAAPDVVGSVGQMNPASGSANTVSSGQSFTVTVEAYQEGVTDLIEGDNYQIECHLYWSKVSAFGGAWQATPYDSLMTFKEDSTVNPANDVYTVTVAPLSGKYEFTAYCVDTYDAEAGQTWATMPNGNVKLTVTPPTASYPCSTAAADNNVFWDALLHDSFATDYRNPTGAVKNIQPVVTLQIRACRGDLTAAKLRVWDDRINAETMYDMAVGPEILDPTLGEVTFWTVDLPILPDPNDPGVPRDPTILYYTFRVIDGSKTVYYRDDDPKFYGGGRGTPSDNQGEAEQNSYQLTVYDQNFTTPDWMQQGVVYQIFPDRFRDGNTAYNQSSPRFYYNQSGGTIWRSYATDWNTLICDPRSVATPACADRYGDNLYGGDLVGITNKIKSGYFNNLGVSVLYLTPIFQSPSNHKYDTMNYRVLDPDFAGPSGTTAFLSLTSNASAKRIKIVLDGVFNHTSSDSAYFDLYSRWNSLDKINPGNQSSPGQDDNVSACESPNSTRRAWYYIPDTGSPATGESDRCDSTDTDDRLGPWTQTYTAWYGYGTLPKLNPANQGVRDLIYARGASQALPSIGPYWVKQGADGWRLDVGGDIDPGLTNEDPAQPNDYWEGFRTQIKDTTVQTRTVPLIVGEEWGDASPWLLGSEWDSAMNYRLRATVLDWLFTGCSGNGCSNGTTFEDNDSNASSASGPISALTPTQFDARLRSIQEDYPPVAFKAMMNIGDSHDTNRLRFLLKKINNDDDAAAQQRMKEYWLFNVTYAGAPTLYYGDEMQVQADGVWANGKWEDDPYNRVPFPWDDTPGAYTAYTETLPYLRALTSARQGYAALQTGDVQHGLVVSDAEKMYGYARTLELDPGNFATAFVALNRDTTDHTAVFGGLEKAPYMAYDGQLFMDVLTRATYNVACDDPTTPAGCKLTVPAPAQLGAVLVEPGRADQPDPPLPFAVITNTVDLNINWAAIIRDTSFGYEFPDRYELWRSETPYGTPGPGGDMTLIGENMPGDFEGERYSYVDPEVVGDPEVNHFYTVVSVNGAGGRSLKSREEAEFDFSLTPGSE